jgi:hypothetical protein
MTVVLTSNTVISKTVKLAHNKVTLRLETIHEACMHRLNLRCIPSMLNGVCIACKPNINMYRNFPFLTRVLFKINSPKAIYPIYYESHADKFTSSCWRQEYLSSTKLLVQSSDSKISLNILISCFVCSSTIKMEAKCSSETSVDLKILHGVVSQKIELFIIIAVRTSNPIIF